LETSPYRPWLLALEGGAFPASAGVVDLEAVGGVTAFDAAVPICGGGAPFDGGVEEGVTTSAEVRDVGDVAAVGEDEVDDGVLGGEAFDDRHRD